MKARREPAQRRTKLRVSTGNVAAALAALASTLACTTVGPDYEAPETVVPALRRLLFDKPDSGRYRATDYADLVTSTVTS